MVGTGPIVKTTSDTAALLGNVSSYSGSITVLGGLLQLPGGIIASALTVENGTLNMNFNTTIQGSLKIGENGVFGIPDNTITFSPSLLTLGANAQIYLGSSWTVNINTPLTDATDPTRRISIYGPTVNSTGFELVVATGSKEIAMLATNGARVQAPAPKSRPRAEPSRNGHGRTSF